MLSKDVVAVVVDYSDGDYTLGRAKQRQDGTTPRVDAFITADVWSEYEAHQMRDYWWQQCAVVLDNAQFDREQEGYPTRVSRD